MEQNPEGKLLGRKRLRGLRSSLGKVLRRDRYLAAATIALVVTWGLVLFFPIPHDPNTQELSMRLTPPFVVPGHALGTDHLGRDVLSNLLLGTRVSMMIASAVVIIACTTGALLGIVSGYFGGILDNFLMRLVDLQLSIPIFFMALAGSVILGKGVLKLIGILAFTGWVRYARVARASTISVRETMYIEAGRSIGVGSPRLMFRHILPNIAGPLLVIAFVELPAMMMVEASLSFLGFGLPVETPSIGKMINAGYPYLLRGDWWVSLLPGSALFWIVMTVNMFIDAIRDRLDPRLRTAQKRR